MGTNKKAFFIIFCLAVLVIGSIGAYYFVYKPYVSKLSVSLSNSKASIGDPVLSFQTNSANVLVGDTFQVNINIDAGSKHLSGVELHLKFPSAVIQATALVKGSFLPVELSPANISGDNATIILGSEPASPKTGAGTLAILTFKALAAGSAQIQFDTTTKVAVTEGDGNSIGSSGTLSITVAIPGCSAPLTETQTLSCPAGSSGSITQSRTKASYPSCTWGGWTTISNTCAANSKILTVNKVGTGSGTAGPAGAYNSGQVVTLTQSSSTGSTFTGWTGDADCTNGSVTMTADKTCIATFSLNSTPTPTPSVTPTPSRTPTPTLTPSITPTPSRTPTPTLTPSITPTPSRTPTPTPSITPTPSPLNSNLIRFGGDPLVYQLTGSQIKLIFNEQVAVKLGLSWSNIQTRPASEKTAYSRVKLERASGDTKVYYITESGLKRWMINEAAFLSYGNRWENIVTVQSFELSAIPDNILVRASGDTKVYKLEGKTKRWITSASAFNNNGFDWTKIAPVNQTELNAYSIGAPLY